MFAYELKYARDVHSLCTQDQLRGVIPAWPHSNKWGYGPSSGVGLILLILVILLVMGRYSRLPHRPPR